MDIPRPSAARARRRRRIVFVVLGSLALLLVTVGLSRLQPAAPSIDMSQLWTNTVQRGQMLRQVHGNGTLVPEEIVWIPSINQGRVLRILTLPGAAVKADTVLVELANPDVEQAAFDAEWQVKAAESELVNLRVQLQTQRLNQQALVASAQANHNNARLEAEVNEELAKSGLVPELIRKQTRAKADELAKLLEIEQERLLILAEAAHAQLAVQEARVAQGQAVLQLKRGHAEALKIRAGFDGVLQKLGDTVQLQQGQQLAPGANVARVANPARLKAEIKIYETQAKDVQLGQVVEVDTRNGTSGKIPGRVVRIDPAVQNGTVTVDVALEGPLPRGARPDLSVEGTIELERLQDVMFVGKPVGSNSDAPMGLFRLTPNGKEARRVTVKLGRSSVNFIEVLEGLSVGDTVILSDMSQWDAHDRVRLN